MTSSNDGIKEPLTSGEKGPSVVVKRDPEPEEMPELIEFLASELGLLSTLDQSKMKILSSVGVWEWESYQEDIIDCPSWLVCNKPRQAGVSFAFAAKGLSRGSLSKNNYSAIFTSFKKEEAEGKIQYVKQMLDALPPQFKKKVIRDPQQLVEWENSNGTRVKIISHAQRPIRGINGDVFLDELAFYALADEIYESALPAVSAVRGTVDVTSTPFGKSGKFYELISDPIKYPKFKRLHLKWWHNRRNLKRQDDEFLVKAMINAPNMSLEERVYTYANSYLMDQFLNAQDKDSFRQEFEGYFVDEQAAFFNRALILSCMFPTSVEDIDSFSPVEEDFSIPVEDALAQGDCEILKHYSGVLDINNRPILFKKFSSLEELQSAVHSGQISYRLFGGADVAGSSGHAAHFAVIEEIILKNGETLQIERYSRNSHGWGLTEQTEYYKNILRSGLLRKLRVDRTGMGEHMNEELVKEFGDSVVEGIHMGGSNKRQEEHMTNLRMRMSTKTIALGMDMQMIEDLYSIKRIISPTKSVSYKAPERKKHHADAAWALAFASLAGTKFGEKPASYSFHIPSEIVVPRAVSNLNSGISIEAVDRYFDQFNFSNSGSVMDSLSLRNMAHPGHFINNYEE
jgi:phage FluMu gp28-like protein